MIVPIWARVLALSALVIALVGVGYVRGASDAELRFEVIRAKESELAAAEIERLSKKGAEVVLQYVTRTERVEGASRTIVKEIPKYVSAKSDAGCVVPVGFVRLLSPSVDVQAGLYRPSADVDEAASGVALSAVAEFVTEARRRFELNKAQCDSLMQVVSDGPRP